VTVLHSSKDRKVANLVTKNGKQAAISNTFGLANGIAASCVGATKYCEKICYAGSLENTFTAVGRNMQENYKLLRYSSISSMTLMLDELLYEFVKKSTKAGADMIYRIHWDGDFFNGAYTKAWSVIIGKYYMVQFWVYTRSLDAAISLHTANHDNLSLYFSADPENKEMAKKIHKLGIRIAAVDETFADSQALVKEITGRVGAKCPEQTGQIPLISSEGSACARCRLCVDGKANISFSRTKK